MPQKSKRANLREGFTTGSAASAAATAALAVLLGERTHSDVHILPPPGESAHPEPPRLRIPLHYTERKMENGTSVGYATVIKDGGDDPDATNGMLITAHVSFAPLTSGLPATALSPTVTLYAGEGIGVVTLPGLPVPVGEMAVNPAPRRQIAAALHETAKRLGYEGHIHCRLSAPEGVKRARKTLNSRLGILGGISILGTGGTVKPFSASAWKATISQGLDVALAAGLDTVCLTTGRRSERALHALFPSLPSLAFIQAADHAGYALAQAAHHNFTHILWGCFPGKLLKLAQGLAWTHARTAAADFVLLEKFLIANGLDNETAHEAVSLPTVTGALDIVRSSSPGAYIRTMEHMAKTALESMQTMMLCREMTPLDKSLTGAANTGGVVQQTCLDKRAEPIQTANMDGSLPKLRVYAFDMQGALIAQAGE